MDPQQQKFLDLLNSEYQWPTVYPFKFVVKTSELQVLCGLFPSIEPVQKHSSGGQYVSVTFQILIQNGEEVLEYYQRVQGVPGLISL